MKTANAKELNDKFKDCPTQMTEIEIEGRKYVVISHFTGQKDLDDVVYKNAYKQAMDEVLHARKIQNKRKNNSQSTGLFRKIML